MYSIYFCVFLTPWADDSWSKPAGGVRPGSVAAREVDVSTQETHHTDLHVDPVINQIDQVINATITPEMASHSSSTGLSKPLSIMQLKLKPGKFRYGPLTLVFVLSHWLLCKWLKDC